MECEDEVAENLESVSRMLDVLEALVLSATIPHRMGQFFKA